MTFLREDLLKYANTIIAKKFFPDQDYEYVSDLTLAVVGALYMEEGIQEFNGIFDLKGELISSTFFPAI